MIYNSQLFFYPAEMNMLRYFIFRSLPCQLKELNRLQHFIPCSSSSLSKGICFCVLPSVLSTYLAIMKPFICTLLNYTCGGDLLSCYVDFLTAAWVTFLNAAWIPLLVGYQLVRGRYTTFYDFPFCFLVGSNGISFSISQYAEHY